MKTPDSISTSENKVVSLASYREEKRKRNIEFAKRLKRIAQEILQEERGGENE